MSKNIVVCSDGTGNSGGKRRGTNVWRIFNAVDRYDEDHKQVTYYDDGVGTHNIRLLRLFGGAFGVGLSRNIREAYEFLAVNYQPGDRIFLFGFSRGAFTVRSLAGMICRCGLLERGALLSQGRRARNRAVKRILRAYRSEKTIFDDASAERIRKSLGIDGLPLQSVEIHFVGVWDTVDAMGVPFDWLKEWVNPAWKLFFGRRCWGFHDLQPHSAIRHAYQALALDDERRTFHPLVWEVPKDPADVGSPKDSHESASGVVAEDHGEQDGKQIVRQVWFAGVHSNVGGGYPKDSLSLVPLLWMMSRAEGCGLRFLRSKWEEYREGADPHGRLYDSRTGLGMFYRYARRNPYRPNSGDGQDVDPFVHASVIERIKRPTGYYAPKVLRPDQYTEVPADVPRSAADGRER